MKPMTFSDVFFFHYEQGRIIRSIVTGNVYSKAQEEVDIHGASDVTTWFKPEELRGKWTVVTKNRNFRVHAMYKGTYDVVLVVSAYDEEAAKSEAFNEMRRDGFNIAFIEMGDVEVI